LLDNLVHAQQHPFGESITPRQLLLRIYGAAKASQRLRAKPIDLLCANVAFGDIEKWEANPRRVPFAFERELEICYQPPVLHGQGEAGDMAGRVDEFEKKKIRASEI
jgi:hypothetical protein